MIGYVARDANGELYLHTEKPYYYDDSECWFSSPEEIRITNKFPQFDYLSSDDEPVKVEIKLEKV